MSSPELDLLKKDKGFVLRRIDSNGTVTELYLTQNNVLTLSQSAEQMAQLVLSNYTSEINPVAAFPAETIALNCDQHRDELHLDLVSPGGSRKIVAIPLPKAKVLAERLPSYIAEMEAYRREQATH